MPILQNPPEKRTESGTPNDQNTPLDPDLVKLIEVWPTLPADTRAAILREAGL
ncbi:MAG: hypothetical protein NTZ17_14725 [Phycisphaerae bacterium]|nr:hypothetical protein [Phycisphaerae bacterium]